MKIKDIMSTPAVAVPAITPVAAVARHMDHSGVGCVLVTENGALKGIVTDRDLTLRVLACDQSGDLAVGQVMSPRPVAVRPDDDLDVAFQIFRRNDFRRIPVVDDELVLGMLTLDDLLVHLHQRANDLLGPVVRELLEPQHESIPHQVDRLPTR